jgi:hypothetical protein
MRLAAAGAALAPRFVLCFGPERRVVVWAVLSGETKLTERHSTAYLGLWLGRESLSPNRHSLQIWLWGCCPYWAAAPSTGPPRGPLTPVSLVQREYHLPRSVCALNNNKKGVVSPRPPPPLPCLVLYTPCWAGRMLRAVGRTGSPATPVHAPQGLGESPCRDSHHPSAVFH